MEREQTSTTNLKAAGYQAAEALRGYGYPDLAAEYERVLRRSALDSQEVRTHSRIASSTLKELNGLAESQQGKHPALARNMVLQQHLEAALQKQAETGIKRSGSIENLSFPAKLYLEESSKPLKNAALEVAKYLEGKRQYSHSNEGKTLLQRNLDTQLQSYRSLPTSQNMEKLETYTQQGIQVMKQDYEAAKVALQKENEQYVIGRDYLSPHGRNLILSEAEKGEFEMPNRVAGKHVLSRANYAQEQLDQYEQVKETILALDQPKESPLSPNPKLEKNYAHLSAEQQQHYAALSIQSTAIAPAKEQEREVGW